MCQNARKNENLGKHKRVEDREEEEDCKKVEEDGWLHWYQGGGLSETGKHFSKFYLKNIKFDICLSEKPHITSYIEDWINLS